MAKFIDTGIALRQDDGSIGYAYFRTEQTHAVEQALKNLLDIYLDPIEATDIKIKVQDIKMGAGDLMDVRVVIDFKDLEFDISEE